VTLPTPECGGNKLNIDTVFVPHSDPRLSQLDWPLLAHALSFHYDGVPTNISPRLLTVASSHSGLVYMVRHHTLPIYGIQSHPDASYTGIRTCLAHFGVNPDSIVLESASTYASIFTNFFAAMLA
jgi:hypothetical protein